MARPTLYDPKYCDEILEYFSVSPYEERTKQVITKKGNIAEIEVTEANDFPSFAGFAAKIGVHRQTLHDWKAQHPEFSYAYKKAKEFQENFLVVNGNKGLINPAFAIFTAKNVLGWRDKQPGEEDKTLTLKGEVKLDKVDLDERVKQLKGETS